MIPVQNNESSYCLECAKRGKTCCQNYGGTFHPLDFTDENTPLTEEMIEKILTERDDVSIDWFEDADDIEGNNGYFLRARHVGGDIVDPSWGAECVHLKENGCDLPFDERPYGCRLLIPTPEKCGTGTEKVDGYLWWKDLQFILSKLKNKFNKHTHTGERTIDLTSFWELLIK